MMFVKMKGIFNAFLDNDLFYENKSLSFRELYLNKSLLEIREEEIIEKVGEYSKFALKHASWYCSGFSKAFFSVFLLYVYSDSFYKRKDFLECYKTFSKINSYEKFFGLYSFLKYYDFKSESFNEYRNKIFVFDFFSMDEKKREYLVHVSQDINISFLNKYFHPLFCEMYTKSFEIKDFLNERGYEY